MNKEKIKYKYFDVSLDQSELTEEEKNYLKFYTGEVSIQFYSIENKSAIVSTMIGAGIHHDQFHIKIYLRFYDDGIDINEIKNMKAKIIDVKTGPILEIRIIINTGFYHKYELCKEIIKKEK